MPPGDRQSGFSAIASAKSITAFAGDSGVAAKDVALSCSVPSVPGQYQHIR